MGLLDGNFFGDGFDDPRSAAIMGLLAGNRSNGGWMTSLLGAQRGYTQAKAAQAEAEDRALQRSIRQEDLALKKLAEKRAQSKFDGQQEAIRGVDARYGMLGTSQPAIAPSAGSELGGGTYGIPMGGQRQVSAPSPVAAELARLEKMAIAEVPGAKESLEIFKYRNDPQKREGGSYYVNSVTGESLYMPKLPDMMMPDSRGGVRLMPGATQAQSELTLANEGVKALLGSAGRLNLRTMPDNSQRPVSELSENDALQRLLGPLLGRAPQAAAVSSGLSPVAPQAGTRISPDQQRALDSDRPAILQGELRRATELFANSTDPAVKARAQNDIAAVSAELRRIGVSASVQAAPQAMGPYGMTNDQSAAAAAAKAKAEEEAKLAAQRGNDKEKRSDKATDMLDQIGRAKTLLGMNPTASGIGSVADKAMSWVGASTAASQNASALENVAGWLTSNVPRMEGPQSNYDVDNYKIMAGRVGDRTLPVADRMKALEQVEFIQGKYAHLNKDAQNNEGRRPNLVDSLPKTAARGARARDTTTGEVMVFNGISWVKEK